MTRYLAASEPFASTSTLPIFTVSPSSAATSSRIGVCLRQGPHHVAQKSTRTVPAATVESKLLSFSSSRCS